MLQGRTILAPDLRGHGASPPARRSLELSTLAAEVAALVAKHEAAPVHVVGLSLGAAVALQLAMDRPQLVRSLSLINGFAHLGPSSLHPGPALGRLFLLLMGQMDWLARWVARDLFPVAEQRALREMAAARIAANDRRSYRTLISALARFDARNRVNRIGCPALVIVSDDDRILAKGPKLDLARAIPGARLLRLRDSGHAAAIDSPDRVNASLRHFLVEVEGGKAI